MTRQNNVYTPGLALNEHLEELDEHLQMCNANFKTLWKSDGDDLVDPKWFKNGEDCIINNNFVFFGSKLKTIKKLLSRMMMDTRWGRWETSKRFYLSGITVTVEKRPSRYRTTLKNSDNVIFSMDV